MSAIHHIIGKRAYELLPAEERNFWEAEKESIPNYCDLPDLHLASQWEDLEKEKWYARYDVMPNGKCAPHGLVDQNWICSALGSGKISAANTQYVFRYYMRRIISLIRKKDPVESARFMGTMAHTIQDCSCPCHIIDNVLLNHLFPPVNGTFFPLHSVIDSWELDTEKVTEKPELLGRTVEEAAFRLNETILRNVELMTGDMVELVQSIYQGRKSVTDRIMHKWNSVSVHLTASAWHTLYAIAARRITDQDQEAFRELDLTELSMIQTCHKDFDRRKYIARGIPFYECIYLECDPFRSRLSTDRIPFEMAVNESYDENKHSMELELQKDGRSFRGKGKGFSAGSYGVAAFRVPGKIYGEVEMYAGVHYRSTSDVKITFALWCPEAEDNVLAMGQVSYRDDALHFKVALPEKCKTLILLCAGGNSGTTTVFLDPVLRTRN